jgi:hypothetical protein
VSDEAKADSQGIEFAVYMCFGTAGVVKNQREMARKILDNLRRVRNLERKELMRRIGLDPEDDNDNQNFDNTVRKLLGENKFDVHVINKFRKGNEMYYHVDITGKGSFSTDLSSLKKSIKYALVDSPVTDQSDVPWIMEEDGRES